MAVNGAELSAKGQILMRQMYLREQAAKLEEQRQEAMMQEFLRKKQAAKKAEAFRFIVSVDAQVSRKRKQIVRGTKDVNAMTDTANALAEEFGFDVSGLDLSPVGITEPVYSPSKRRRPMRASDFADGEARESTKAEEQEEERQSAKAAAQEEGAVEEEEVVEEENLENALDATSVSNPGPASGIVPMQH
jgi:hypothetical protein